MRNLSLTSHPLLDSSAARAARDQRALVRRVREALIVVQGTRDELGSAVEMKKFLARRANMRVHPIEGADHSFGEAEQLDQAAGIIARFIARRVAKGSGR